MSVNSVTFGIEGKRVLTQYDRDQLRLGSIVYVRFSSEKEPVAFSQRSSEGTIAYAVRWIAPSEWHVELVPEFRLRPEFAQRVHDEIGEYISRNQIDAALTAFASRVRLEHFYKTSELRNNPLSVVFTVLERLHVCHQLQRPEVRRALFGYDEPLLSYLYLTCFDRLGQPADWLGFGNWLKSSRHKDEREKATQQISSTDNIIDAVQLVHSYYTSLYGVKSSFFRFLHEILPSEVHRELLRTVEIHILTNPPQLTERREVSDAEKEIYLFKRRNDYTHKADFRPPGGEWLGRSYVNPVQEFHTDHWTTIRTIGWPEILDKVVRVGLARYLLRSQEEQKSSRIAPVVNKERQREGDDRQRSDRVMQKRRVQ